MGNSSTQARKAAIDVRVRRARSHDLNDVVGLWQGCGLVPSARGFRNELQYKLLREPNLALVAERDGEVVGAVTGGYDGRASWVSRLGVRGDARRQGIGRLLVSRLLERLADVGASTDELLVLDETANGQVFWHGLGFAETAGAARYARPVS